MSGEFDGAPLVAGTVTGVRRFRVDELGRLRGPQQGTVWRPGDNDARCNRQDGMVSMFANMNVTLGGGYNVPKAVPESKPVDRSGHLFASCRCGFYAYADGHDAAEYGGDNTVAAAVEAWGDVMVGTRGFRASHARVLAITIPDSMPVSDPVVVARAALERRYGRFTFRPLWRRFAYADDHNFSTAASVAGVILALSGFMASAVLFAASQVPAPAQPSSWLSLIGAVIAVFGAALSVTGSRGFSAYLEWKYPTVSKIPEVRAMHDGSYRRGATPPSVASIEALRANYPDVHFYGSYEAMVAAYPPSPGERPTPANDPEFWGRP